MSLLSYNDLVGIVNSGIVENVTPDMINSTSIDLTLGDKILIEHNPNRWRVISLNAREPLEFITDHNKHFQRDGYILEPGEFILAQSKQVFYLPNNISAEYKLKSSMARSGLEHLNAGWCDAGWHGSVLTLELKNMTRYHHIHIKPGDKIGQMVFFSHLSVPHDKSYAARGRYNNDKSVRGVKP